MKKIEKHAPGSFCWIELATTDQNAAKKFYSSLLGWAVDDNPMGPSEIYSIFKLQDGNVGAAYTMRPDQRAQGMPPNWMLYVASHNCDLTVKSAGELGGKICAPPFDVADAGRMAVMQDPTGAIFSVWQAKRHIGITVVEAEGTLCWADLYTPDRQKAGKFYSALFGWKLETGDEDLTHGYFHIKNGEQFIGGMPPPGYVDPKVPPHWLIYIQVSDCAKSAAKAKQLGAKVYMEPFKMEDVGTISIVADPQGAVFAIFQPK